MQVSLKYIKVETCPKCGFGMNPISIGKNYVRYWCPNCIKEIVMGICECGNIYQKDNYKLCPSCRKHSLNWLIKTK